MPTRISSTPPKINIGALTGLPWLQEGYAYGRNDSGPFQTWIEEGLDADIDTNAANFLNSGWTYTVTRKKNGMSHMEAHAGWTGGSSYTSEVLENIWELDPMYVDKSILEADFPNGSAVTLGSKKTRAALGVIMANDTGVWSPNIPGTTGTANYGGNNFPLTYLFDDGVGGADTTSVIHLLVADYAPAYSLYLLMKAGVSAFPVEASAIRHTQLLSNLYTVQAGYSNVGRIISTSSMTSVEGVPTGLLYAVPFTPTPTQFIETSGDLQYGWKKMRPSVTRLALFKWRVVQNWQLGLWPIKLFGTVL